MAVSSTVSDGVTYLLMAQTQDGSWGSTPTSLNGPFPTTAEVLITFNGFETVDDTVQSDGVAFLADESAGVIPYISSRILALSDQGVDLTADVSALLAAQNDDGGWGTDIGFGSDVPDTALALSALHAAGLNDSAVTGQALNYLRYAQNTDGGWGLLRGKSSEVYYSALALQALNDYRFQYTLTSRQLLALDYLRSRQNGDGGYGRPNSTSFETALILLAVLDSGFPLTQAEDDATTYLENGQQANGSWINDPYSTALALRGLAFPIDSDGDGMPDDCENANGLNPNDPSDATLDNDGDGLSNRQECRLGTDPNDSNTDDDLVNDYVEVSCQSDPLNQADFNRRPVINSAPVTIASEDESYNYQVAADDPDSDDLNYTLLQSPAGMTIRASGLITWTPTASQVSSYNVVVDVSDAKCSAQQPYRLNVLAQGIDLTVESVDTSAMTTNLQTLVTLGAVSVDVGNRGASPFNGSFTVLLFEDTDGDAAYNSGLDTALGATTFSGQIPSNDQATLDIPVSGVVLFRDNLVYAYVDHDEQVVELDEDNNLGHSGQASLYQPPVDQFQPVVELHWDDPKGTTGVSMAPVVAPITDTNGDGLINERDVPAIIVATTATELVAIQGDTGQEILRIPNLGPGPNSQVAVGDLDGDGIPELLLRDFFGDVRVFSNKGVLLWTGAEINWFTSTPSLADLDADGSSEVLHPKTVFNADGSTRWSGGTLYTGGGGPGATFQAADLDLDDVPEIVIGPSAYDRDGNMLWEWRSYLSCNITCYQIEGKLDGGVTTVLFTSTMSLNDGWSTVLNLDNDPYPEVVLVTSAAGSSAFGLINDVMWIFEHDGQLHAGPFQLGQGQDIFNEIEYRLGAPAVADIDGDGQPEIIIAATKFIFPSFTTFADPTRIILTAYRFDGTLIWQRDLIAAITTNGAPPVAAFDFDGDGASELVFLDVEKMYILNGADGETLFEMAVDRMNEGSPIRYPIVADVDNDGNAEIVVPTYMSYQAGSQPHNGLLVLGDSQDNWGHARRIWNQWNYNITNVEEDASIPSVARNNWEIYENFREQAPIEGIDRFAAPDLSVSRVVYNQDLCPASAGITARIGNGGGLHVAAGLPVNFYLGDPASGGNLLGTVETTRALYPGQYEDVSFDWNGPSAGDVYVAVNETITNPLTTTVNLAQLPHTWAQGSGLSSGGVIVPANFKTYYGIDGNLATGWSDNVFNNIDPTHYYEVHFPFPVNASAITITNSFANSGFLTGTLSFSNGYTTTFSLDANGEGPINFPEQSGITWLRLDAAGTKPDGVSLNEIVVPGSYREPVSLLNEGTGRMANNKSASGSLLSPCDAVSNQPPQITSSPSITAAINVTYTYSVQAVDPNSDALNYSLLTGPFGMSIDGTGLVSWTPTLTDMGVYSVTVQVSDGNGGVAQQSFTIEVVAPAGVNLPPQITSSPPLTATYGLTYTYLVEATDPNGDLVLFSLPQAPAGATLDPITGVLAWAPGGGLIGDINFTVRAQDTLSATTQGFIVTVILATEELPPLPVDLDDDGFDETADCDDNNGDVNPGMPEIPGNGLDDDCNPATPDELPAGSLLCTLVTDKRSYFLNTLVQATVTIQSESDDLSILGLDGNLAILNSGGQTVYTDALTVNALPPNGRYRTTFAFNNQALPIDAYLAEVDVNFADQLACQADARFDVIERPLEQHPVFLPIIGLLPENHGIFLPIVSRK